MFNGKGEHKIDQKGDSNADEPQGEGYYSAVGGGSRMSKNLEDAGSWGLHSCKD